MSIKFCILIVLLSATISAQTNHSEIIKAGRADLVEAGFKDNNSSDLFLLPDVRNNTNAFLLNGSTLSDIFSNITFNVSEPVNKMNIIPPKKPRRVAPVPPANLTSILSSGENREYLYGDQRLLPNQALLSRNQQFAVHISPSCDLQIVRVSDQVPVWKSNTSSALIPCSAYMSRSGVLSLLDRNLLPIWKTDSNRGQEPATFMIGDDGNATITDPSWSALWKSNRDWRRDHMNGGETVSDPVPLATFNRMYSVNITRNCQLAVRRMGVRQPIFVVGNPVTNATQCRLSLGRSGDLSLQNEKGDVLWYNDEAVGYGEEPFHLRVLLNGTLALTSAEVPIWYLNEMGFTMLA